MTEIAAAPPRALDMESDAARARVARRYRAEFRFKLYGMAAVAFAALFIVILLVDVILKAAPAFTQSRLTLDVPLTAESLGISDPQNPSALASANYIAPLRDRLRELLPDASDRRSRRLLNGLLSAGAADDLRRRVLADPSLIGQTVSVSALLSDDADLWLKGLVSETESRTGEGAARPSGTTGTITVTSSANDFSTELAGLKAQLAASSETLRSEADRFAASKASIETRLQRARASLSGASPAERGGIEAEIGRLQADVASLDSAIQERMQRAAALSTRASAAAAPEKLDVNDPSVLIRLNGGIVKATELSAGQVTGEVLRPLADANEAAPGSWRLTRIERPEGSRNISDREISWLDHLSDIGATRQVFNTAFFTTGDSREAELAGILGALVGSAFTMLITLAICLPVGVAAAVYLEEFAPKNRWTDLIEVNINNLAAVPSIVFGLLGLAVFLNYFHLPRSAPLVGGLVLALLVLPTIIIAGRAALKAVPPSVREAALGVGASHQQAVFHHVLPLAAPGILTGTIIGMAHALGETAPLLMIGMVAFIADVPGGLTDAATALPVQIYLWSDLPEVGFQAKTAAAILVLLLFLFAMNAGALYLRKRFERRW